MVVGITSLEFTGEDRAAPQIWETSAYRCYLKLGYWIRSQNGKSEYKRVEVQRVSPRLPRRQGDEGKPDEKTEKQPAVKEKKK